jgi:diacylglycerol kinase family enzyme
MEKLSPRATIAIFNPRSGNGYERNAVETLMSKWPNTAMVKTFDQIKHHPQIIKNYDVVAGGGDGTLATVANWVRLYTLGRLTYLDFGSVGDMAKSLGNGRNGETIEEYVERMATLKKENRLTELDLCPGTIRGERTEYVQWCAGLGAIGPVALNLIEKARDKGYINWLRLLYAGFGILNNLKNDVIYEAEITKTGQKFAGMNFEVVLEPFFREGSMTLPGPAQDRLIVVKPPEKGRKVDALLRVMTDALSMKFKQEPRAGGIALYPIPAGSEVIIKGAIDKIHIDSIPMDWSGAEVIINPRPEPQIEPPYRLMVAGGKNYP